MTNGLHESWGGRFFASLMNTLKYIFFFPISSSALSTMKSSGSSSSSISPSIVHGAYPIDRVPFWPPAPSIERIEASRLFSKYRDNDSSCKND